MLAARFHAPGQRVRVEEVPEPEARPGEVLVRVAACGICASDLHLLHGTMPLPVTPPVTMGHEPSGTVVAIGDGVAGWTVGDRVAIHAGKPCGSCDRCRVGDVEACRRPQVMGIHYDGAWAELVAVPSWSLAPVPDGLPFEHAAIACDAVSTPFAALVNRGGLRPGERVGLWGVGGLGTHAVQLARLAGASFVVAVDPLEPARERAQRLGADLVLDPSEPVHRRIRAETGGAGLDLALDLVGSPAAVTQALRSVGSGGRVVVVGQSFEPIDAGPLVLFSYRAVSLLGHLGYRKRHLEHVLALMGSGRLDVSGSITDVFPLERVNEGIERLRAKDDPVVRILVRPGRG